MEWLSFLFLLACPLMMLFCMKGMFSGNKQADAPKAQVQAKQPQVSVQDMQALQIKMAEMMEQNHNLMKEIYHSSIKFSCYHIVSS